MNFPKQDIQNDKFDCALMCFYYWPNYGSALTAFALRKAISGLGYNTKFINIKESTGYFKQFNLKYGDFTHKCINYKDLDKLNSLAHTFILGSDNQLCFPTKKNRIYTNLFNFVSDKHKKIIIAGSFGDDDFIAPQEEMQKIKSYFQCFDYISVREKSGTDICKKHFDCDADWLVDPVFILDKKDYDELISNTENDYKDKIMCYLLNPNEETKEICNYFASKYNQEISYFWGNEEIKKHKITKDLSVENWLSAIKNSKLIITDSFHGICFSLIFNKPFICINNKYGKCRFDSLFEMFELKNPICKTLEDAKLAENALININYEKINETIKERREYALNKVKTLIENPKTISDKQRSAIQSAKEINRTNAKNDIYKKFYRQSKILYLYIVEPLVIPIIGYIKQIIRNYS